MIKKEQVKKEINYKKEKKENASEHALDALSPEDIATKIRNGFENDYYLGTNENAIYENNSVNMANVRLNNDRVIFFGENYCLRQTYCTFNLNDAFKNYCRVRPGCYDPWQWE